MRLIWTRHGMIRDSQVWRNEGSEKTFVVRENKGSVSPWVRGGFYEGTSMRFGGFTASVLTCGYDRQRNLGKASMAKCASASVVGTLLFRLQCLLREVGWHMWNGSDRNAKTQANRVLSTWAGVQEGGVVGRDVIIFQNLKVLKKVNALLIILFPRPFIYPTLTCLSLFSLKNHIFQGIDALCMVHSLEGVYVGHVTSGCHGNFSLLLNWKIITLAKIPHNLSMLKLKMPGGSPGTRIPFLVERDRDGDRRESGMEAKCFCGCLNIIKTFCCYLTECISHPNIWFGCQGNLGSPVRWDKRTKGFRCRNA